MITEAENVEEEKFEDFVLNSKDDSNGGVEDVDNKEETKSNNVMTHNHNKELGVGMDGLDTYMAKESADMIIEAENVKEEKSEDFVLNSKDDLNGGVEDVDKMEETKSADAIIDQKSEIVSAIVKVVKSSCVETGIEDVDKKEETKSNDVMLDEHSEIVFAIVEAVKSSIVEVDQMVHKNLQTNDMPNSIESPQVELSENDSSESDNNSNPTLQGVEDLKDRSSVSCSGDALELSNKLSASAAPFNPSPAVARARPVSMNIILPSGPGVVATIGPWPLNMTLHPRPPMALPMVNPMCSSPHPPYPSPPPTPNMIHSLPFFYPIYTQPQAVPTTTFPMTSNPFHTNHFAWQCNMSPNGVHWPMCRPMELSVSPTVVEPIIGPIVEPKEQVDNSESPSLAPNPLVDIANGSEADKESNFLASEAVEIGNKAIIRSEDEKEIGDLNPHGVLSSGDQPITVTLLMIRCQDTLGKLIVRKPSTF
ncbi:hypothetical protein LOK49_LG03G02103 [Camellia lanceoleosa]|uniref:Uncharacterized protein n=1 Tax=Camellia lanceoleosa TaxID=1840588 RepID=A0ACC0IE04_9ERIC|nr:hypothetical protein LOK49_LG03G02103 [Camellia lanceoleosa]